MMVANEFNKPLFILFHFNYYASMEGLLPPQKKKTVMVPLKPLFDQEYEDIVIFPDLKGFKIT